MNKIESICYSNDKDETSIKQETTDFPASSRVSMNKSCASCHLAIDDRYIFNLMNTYWHEDCLQCSQCGQLLHQTCFYKNGQLFCKSDYLRYNILNILRGINFNLFGIIIDNI